VGGTKVLLVYFYFNYEYGTKFRKCKNECYSDVNYVNFNFTNLIYIGNSCLDWKKQTRLNTCPKYTLNKKNRRYTRITKGI